MYKVSLVALATVLLIAGCSDQTTVYSDPQNDVTTEGNASILENSIVFDNSGVLDIYGQDGTTGKFSLTAKAEEAGDYPLTLIAQVKPPSFTDGGQNLTASHVYLSDDYAYVAYNTAGIGYAGGIDIIDVSNPNQPKVTSRLYYINADVNSIKYDNGYVYAVGGLDAEKSLSATSNSFVAKIPVVNNTFDTSNIIYGFQVGFNANDIAVTANTVLVTSGTVGGFTVRCPEWKLDCRSRCQQGG